MEELLARKIAAELERSKHLETEALAKKETKKEPGKGASKSSSQLPSHVKALDEILRMDLIQDQNADEIGKIWNLFHAARTAVSASLGKAFYDKLYAASKQHPMVRNL